MFYTYLWLREDGTPYYAGKGVGKRAWLSRSGHRPPKDKSRIFVQYWVDEATAHAYEIYLIDFWGRKDTGTGVLNNKTDGGEGASGSKHSEDTLKKLSTSHKGQKSWNSGTARGIYRRESAWGVSWRVCLWEEGRLKHYGTFHIKEDAEEFLNRLKRR